MATHVDPAAQTLGDASDMELVEYTRAGNSAAFGELWVRHSGAGRAVARSHRFDADDLLSEAFARVFQAISAGGGPTAAFRPYLFTTIRNVSMQWARAKSADASEDLDLIADPSTEEDASLAALDKSLTVNAFRSLPTRWQEALWYSEVEQLSSAEIAPLLGMKANAVSALTYRAREGLRQAWIQAHLQRTSDPECAIAIERLGSYTRGTLGPRESRKVRDHLAGCTSCSIVADEARQVGSRLALVLLPLAAGVSGAAGFLSWMQAGGGSAGGLVAAASMPSSVSSGAVSTAAPIAPAPAGSGSALAGTSNASTASSTTAASTSAASGAGMGAAGIVGGIVGAVALAASVVAAVALGPSLWNAPQESTSASSDDSGNAADDTVAAPPATPGSHAAPAPTPAPPVGDPTPPPGPVVPEASAPETSKPVAPPAASDPVDPPAPIAPAVTPTVPTAPVVEPSVPPVEPTTPPVQPTTPPIEPPVEPEAPSAPSVTVEQAADQLTFPEFSGTAEPLASVQILDAEGNPLVSTTAASDGTWSISDFGESITGDPAGREVTVRQTVDGVESELSPPQHLVVLEAPTIQDPVDGATIPAGSSYAITVNGAVGASIQRIVNGEVREDIQTIGADGTWSNVYGTPTAEETPMPLKMDLGMRYYDPLSGRYGLTRLISYTIV
jgi:RNA polymerase sigma factor (sigma-70 family)